MAIIPVWHGHHTGLVSFVDPDVRRKQIEHTKPTHEVATRLQMMKPVEGALPPEFVAARETYDRAREAYDRAWEAYTSAGETYDRAREAYDRAWEAYNLAETTHRAAIEALHAAECGCGQAWDGKVVLPCPEPAAE